MQPDKFSLRARAKSFLYASNGLKALFKTEHNARIHISITLVVIILSLIKTVNKSEIISLVIVTGFVFVAEIFNTAIEKTIDFISKEKNSQIKIIKDLAAAAVLIAAATAVITGCIIFIPKFL